jgi:hypothetical protein
VERAKSANAQRCCIRGASQARQYLWYSGLNQTSSYIDLRKAPTTFAVLNQSHWLLRFQTNSKGTNGDSTTSVLMRSS